jgi:hypothetical protein
VIVEAKTEEPARGRRPDLVLADEKHADVLEWNRRQRNLETRALDERDESGPRGDPDDPLVKEDVVHAASGIQFVQGFAGSSARAQQAFRGRHVEPASWATRLPGISSAGLEGRSP